MAEGYSEETLDHYENPRHRGFLSDFNARASRTNPVCGDSLAIRKPDSCQNSRTIGHSLSGDWSTTSQRL